MRRIILTTLGLLVLGTVGAFVMVTSRNTRSRTSISRSEILEQGMRKVVLPAVDRLASSAGELKEATRQLAESPTPESLRACQIAWRQVHESWKLFQPSAGTCGLDPMLASEISYWPSFASSVENVIKSQRPLDPAFFEILGAGAKGFYALEYLLFDLPAGNTGKVGGQAASSKPRLSATKLLDDPTAGRRREYVLGLAEHLAIRCQALQQSIHQPEALKQWTARGQDSLNQVVNQLVEVLETAGVGRLARQLEFLSQRRLTYEGIEGVAGGVSLTAYTAIIDGAELNYRGADGPGLDDETRAMNPDLADRLHAQFQRAHTAFQQITLPLDEALVKDRSGVERALTELRALEVLIKADLASALGVTITFGSSDGD